MTVDYLNHAIIELTTECNIGCMHCYNWWKQDGEPPLNQNSYKKAFQLVDRLIKTTSVKHLTFTGGEPTISERFLELVLHAKLNHKKSNCNYQRKWSNRNIPAIMQTTNQLD